MTWRHALAGTACLAALRAQKVQAGIVARRGDASARATRYHEEFEAEMVALLRGAGVTTVELTPAERTEWKRFLAPLRAEAARLAGAAGAEALRLVEGR